MSALMSVADVNHGEFGSRRWLEDRPRFVQVLSGHGEGSGDAVRIAALQSRPQLLSLDVEDVKLDARAGLARITELRRTLLGAPQPVLLEVDTSGPVDIRSLAELIRSALTT